jgi:5'-deoxynucleotidase YfbR-like HD superfamily hydrolase
MILEDAFTDFQTRVYRLAFVKRYSNVPRIHEESVAEHAFFVASILIDLHTEYEFDLGAALLMAIAHDMPELELNDCPHIIKKKYPEIGKAYEECEKRVIETLPPAARLGVQEYDKKETIESKFVHYADTIQCYQYSTNEIRMGNRGYMGVVNSNSTKRINKIKEELNEYRRVDASIEG